TRAVLVAALLFLSTVGLGQIQSAQAGSNHAGSAARSDSFSGGALPAELMELRREGHEAMYNLDHATAVAKFEEIRKRARQPPPGDLFLATALWLGHPNKPRRLQTGLYGSGSSFYADAGASKEDTEGDAVDQDVDRAFRERMAQAK